MAIRVRCTGCGKKVSVDDAFAGGACRCPYCKEIVLVGGSPAGATGARPYAPVERPETPDEPPAEEAGAAPALAREVPLAHRVRLQGIVILVLLGVALVMTVGAVWAGIVLSRQSKEEANQAINGLPGAGAAAGVPAQGWDGGAKAPVRSPAPTAPPAEGPRAAGIKIAAPVVYVLDGGGSMKNVFDYARFLVRSSVLSLGTAGSFDILLSAEEGDKFLVGPGAGGAPAGGYRAGGKDGDAAAKPFLDVSPQGTCDIGKAIESAIARRPRTIVLLRRGEVQGAKELADKAKAAHVVIVAVGLASDSEAKESFSLLTGATGGQARVFSEAGLSTWVEQQPPLE